MSAFTAINLALLPPPDIVEPLDYETVLAELRADLVARAPHLAPVLALESEDINIVLEVVAYRVIIERQRINDAARGVMLAEATGGDLDNLAALFAVERLVITPADDAARPPVPAVLESDASLRRRAQVALEGFTNAGSRGAYIFHGLSASGLVRDIGVESPNPGDVVISVLSHEGQGDASVELIDTVEAVVNGEAIRPLTDNVTVQSAAIQTYQIDAELTFYEGPDASVVSAAAQEAVAAYVDQTSMLGFDVTRSGLFAALHQPGVQNVDLTAPAADLVIGPGEAAFCSAINIVEGGRDV